VGERTRAMTVPGPVTVLRDTTGVAAAAAVPKNGEPDSGVSFPFLTEMVVSSVPARVTL
jgi:hypothetical protein